jgi:hypothetical protein
MISGFHHKVDENCPLLGYYAASSGNILPAFGTTYQSHPQGSKSLTDVSGQPAGPILRAQDFLKAEEGTDRLSQNVGNRLPLLPV